MIPLHHCDGVGPLKKGSILWVQPASARAVVAPPTKSVMALQKAHQNQNLPT